MNILVFDTETTGLPDYKQPSEMPHQPHIVELAALLYDDETGGLVDQLHAIVRPAAGRAARMSDRHLRGRAPKKTGGFCWGRAVRDGAVTYRLFRRDQRGALHMKQIIPRSEWSRAAIATELNRARHALRDQVDVVDLALMGVV